MLSLYFEENGLRDEKYMDRIVVTDCLSVEWGLQDRIFLFPLFSCLISCTVAVVGVDWVSAFYSWDSRLTGALLWSVQKQPFCGCLLLLVSAC